MDKNEEILAIIPARGGSKGLPRKNIKILNKKPLISYTIEAAKNSNYINRIIVSTDDYEIADISKKFGAEIPFMRDESLAHDNSSTIDAILFTLNTLKEKEKRLPKYICLLQCTSPLRKKHHIDEAIEKMFSTKMDAVVSVCEAETNPYWCNIFNDNKLEYFLDEGRHIKRRQDLPKIYRINGAIYLIKTEVFLEKHTFEPENTTGYIMGNENSIDIDNEIDFKIAEFIIKREGK